MDKSDEKQALNLEALEQVSGGENVGNTCPNCGHSLSVEPCSMGWECVNCGTLLFDENGAFIFPTPGASPTPGPAPYPAD